MQRILLILTIALVMAAMAVALAAPAFAGCKGGSNAFFASGKNCHHPGR
jgi:hypothetical protein